MFLPQLHPASPPEASAQPGTSRGSLPASVPPVHAPLNWEFQRAEVYLLCASPDLIPRAGRGAWHAGGLLCFLDEWMDGRTKP